MSIRVAILDDHVMIRKGLCNLLSDTPGIEIVAEYEKPGQLLTGLRAAPPDVLLLDLQLPDYNGEELVPVIKRDYPGVRVIILTSNENMYNVRKLINAGANGYVFKNADTRILTDAINHVYYEESPFLPDEIKDSIRKKVTQADKNISLTPRETDVLKLIAQELTSQEIGALLQINHRTVEIYRQGIMQKLGVKNMVGMVKKAIMLGLIVE